MKGNSRAASHIFSPFPLRLATNGGGRREEKDKKKKKRGKNFFVEKKNIKEGQKWVWSLTEFSAIRAGEEKKREERKRKKRLVFNFSPLPSTADGRGEKRKKERKKLSCPSSIPAIERMSPDVTPRGKKKKKRRRGEEKKKKTQFSHFFLFPVLNRRRGKRGKKKKKETRGRLSLLSGPDERKGKKGV